MSVQFAGQCPWAVSGKVWQKIRAVVALRAADTLGGSQAVSMALDVRQHGSKTPCRWLWWNGIYKRYSNLKYKYGNRHFRCRGYYVSTVGGNKNGIAKYIREQEKEDMMNDQISFKEYQDPFKDVTK